MHMVRHDDKRIQFYVREVPGISSQQPVITSPALLSRISQFRISPRVHRWFMVQIVTKYAPDCE
jgi:hypothetical protein